MNRKQRREMEKKLGKDNSQKLAEKIFQFQNLPDACLACTAAYDKTNKQMARTWNVVVDGEDVRLYCPKCWNMARKVAKEYYDKKLSECETIELKNKDIKT